MYQDPEYDEYDDDEYNYYPEYNDYGYPKDFKIDWAAWEQWLSKAIKEIVEEEKNIWTFSNINLKKKNNDINLTNKNLIYIGSNYYDEAIWKYQYFVNKKINQEYKKHLANNAAHVIRQPNYYKGLFEILN